MMRFLRRILPIGAYEPKHWLDTDRRGEWLVGVSTVVVALYVSLLFYAFTRGV